MKRAGSNTVDIPTASYTKSCFFNRWRITRSSTDPLLATIGAMAPIHIATANSKLMKSRISDEMPGGVRMNEAAKYKTT